MRSGSGGSPPGAPRGPCRRRSRELLAKLPRHLLRIAADPDRDRLGEPDAVRIQLHLNDRRLLRPVVDAVARQRRERIEAGAERQHHVGLRDQLHRGLGAVVAERACGKRVRAGEAVVVLVAGADRRIEALGEQPALVDRVPDHHAAAGENHREAGLRQKPRGFRDRGLAACGALQVHDRRQLDVDLLGPEIARHVDLRRRRLADRVLDHPVEDLGHARGVAHLLLVADHLLEQRHLRHFLEAALADGLVGRLGRHQQQRGVVPVRGLHRGHEVGDAGAVLADAHGDLAGGAGVAVAHEAGVALVGHVPEGDPGLREEVRYRHEGGADDAEHMLDPVPLQHLHEGLFSRHFHRDTFLFLSFPHCGRTKSGSFKGITPSPSRGSTMIRAGA